MIEVKNLTQVYRSGKGIFDINFSVKEGEVFGYLGPNGAGKTTTIRNLMGFSNASEGYATIDGKDCRSHAAELQKIIGYLPGEMAFLENMTGIEFLQFMSDMRGIDDKKRKIDLIDRMEFDVDAKMKKMSKGMKQKVGIIAAFMHDPKVYIFDEPTSGLDPFMQNVFMDLVEEEKNRGKTIIMSSHIFEEVQRACDRAGIIREGHMVAIEDVTSLNKMKSNSYILQVANESAAKQVMASPFTPIELSPLKYKVTANDDFKQFFSNLSSIEITSFKSEQESLEDVFMKYYGEKESGSHE